MNEPETNQTACDSTTQPNARFHEKRRNSLPLRRADRMCFDHESEQKIGTSQLRGLLGRRFSHRARARLLEEPIGLSILVPVYNERSTIRRVIDNVRSVSFPTTTEIIVVDDGSTDGTREILQSFQRVQDVRVLYHENNQGKGGAVQTALRHARGRIVVIQDADEELSPADLLPMYELVSKGLAPVCYGSRFARNSGRFKWRPIYWANRSLNGVCNLLNGLKLTDMNTCYKMMRTDVARRLKLESRGFAMEPEITTKLARMNVAIAELPVSYQPRSRTEGKKIRASEFLRYLLAMFRFRFARRERHDPNSIAMTASV